MSGYDRTRTPLTDQLSQEGIEVHYTDDPGLIPGELDLCIYTPAIPKTLKEYEHFSTTSIPVKKRAAVLGEITRQSKTVAVAGTHGKTTVSTMTAHILHNSTRGCSAFLGGISKNYNSNFLFSENSDMIVVEADEFDRSFLQLEPTVAVVTSMDADHLDIYKDHDALKDTFREFISRTKPEGHILLKWEVQLNYKPADRTVHTYALRGEAEYHGHNIRIEGGRYVFDLVTPEGTIEGLTLLMPGLINVENAVAASAAALLCGASADEVRMALEHFTGIKRRFDIQLDEGGILYIDDYAHHPEEIRGLVSSVRDLYPGRKVLGVFQPHLYSRTRDFADGFAESLDLLDETILLPIYPAREEPMPGVDAEMILKKMKSSRKELLAKEELPGHLAKRPVDIVLTIGAGDIDQLVEPVRTTLLNRINA